MTQTTRPAAENWSCGYEPEPNAWVCEAAATWHGFRLTDGTAIDSMMSSCDQHITRMRARADYAHEMSYSCALPGSRFKWPENVCYTDWDLDALAAVELLERMHAAGAR